MHDHDTFAYSSRFIPFSLEERNVEILKIFSFKMIFKAYFDVFSIISSQGRIQEFLHGGVQRQVSRYRFKEIGGGG